MILSLACCFNAHESHFLVNHPLNQPTVRTYVTRKKSEEKASSFKPHFYLLIHVKRYPLALLPRLVLPSRYRLKRNALFLPMLFTTDPLFLSSTIHT